MQLLLTRAANGNTEIRCASCGMILEEAKACRLDRPEDPNARYATPAGGTVVDTKQLRENHSTVDCYAQARRGRQEAEMAPPREDGEEIIAWIVDDDGAPR